MNSLSLWIIGLSMLWTYRKRVVCLLKWLISVRLMAAQADIKATKLMTAFPFTHFLSIIWTLWKNGCERTPVKTSFRPDIQECVHCISNWAISLSIQLIRTLPDDETSALENMAIGLFVGFWRLMQYLPSSRMLPSICLRRAPLHDVLSTQLLLVDINKMLNDMIF